MMLAAVLLLTHQLRTVTFSHPCASAAVVLEALGEELDTPMRPSGTVNKDFLLLDFKDVEQKEALEKLATTLNATWRESNGTLYLERTLVQETSDFNAEYDQKVKAIRSVLATRVKKPFTPESADEIAVKVRDFGETRSPEAYERFQPIARQLPGHRAMLEMVSLLDLDSLVRTDAGQVTFSSRDYHLPLPKGTEEVVKSLSEEWAIYAAAAAKNGLAGDNVYLRHAGTPSVLASSMQLSAHLNDDGVLFMLSFLADNQWQNLGYHRIDMNAASTEPAWVAGLAMPNGLSDTAYDSVRAMSVFDQQKPLLPALLGGHAHDVALSAPAEALTLAAGERSIVASVPDSAYRALCEQAFPRGAPLSTVVRRMIASGALVVDRDEQWLTARPRSPYVERRTRMDRGAFSAMVRYAHEYKELPVETFAEFVASTVDDRAVMTANHLFTRAFDMSAALPSFGLEPLRLYGLVPKAERKQAETGVIVFNGRTDFQRYAQAIASMARQDPDMNPGKLVERRPLHEQDEALASLPTGEEWSLSVRPLTFIQPYAPSLKAGGFSSFMDVESLAHNMYYQERSPTQGEYDYSRVSQIEGLAVDFNFKRSNGGGVHFGRFADPLKERRYGSFDDLPASIKEQIRVALEAVRKRGGG